METRLRKIRSMLTPINAGKRVDPSLSEFCLSDFYILQKWIDYANFLAILYVSRLQINPLFIKMSMILRYSEKRHLERLFRIYDNFITAIKEVNTPFN